MKSGLISLLILFAVLMIPVKGVIKDETLKFMKNEKPEMATFGGGCFWCIEAVFSETLGVIKAVSGYSGGFVKNPAYREVVSGRTGHAEVVQISYDPEIISYKQLLLIFFTIHDPTTLNRQGADVGPQYRSVIFFHNQKQKETARETISRFSEEAVFQNPIVTSVEPLANFYEAEEYHQAYFKKNPDAGYCQYVVKPKLLKFREKFPEYTR